MILARLENSGNTRCAFVCGTISLQPIVCCEQLKLVKYNQAKTKYPLQFMQFRAVDKHKTQSNLLKKMERVRPLIASSTSGNSISPRKNM